MEIKVEYTDERVSVTFVEGCAGLWGTYSGSRANADRWLRAGMAACEDRIWEVSTGGASHERLDPETYGAADHNRDVATHEWLVLECPPVAKAIMCAEWDGES